MAKQSAGKELSEKLLFSQKCITDIDKSVNEKAQKFCEDYKAFLNEAKTEREAVKAALKRLKKAGYVEFKHDIEYKKGEKVYYVNREKCIIAACIGEKPLVDGIHMSIAHVDAPRLDLKPNPLYEDNGFSLFKTHYYGGIRKYQWTAVPLSLHGIVVKATGETVEINIGEKEGEPVFCITDLLPHLSQEQNKRTLADGIKGEELNILVGSLPFEDKEVKDRVKLYTMKLLNELYGITERDFVRAEIEVVPAFKATDVGFDRSMIGSYAHDDRVCAYTALMAQIKVDAPRHTTVCVLTDKEEVGSDGATGLNSDFVFHFLQNLAENQKTHYRKMLANSKCLSADVNAAMDPTFPEVLERNNAAYLNKGVVITKYTGARGKSSTSDANAEMMGYVTNMLDKAGVTWQTGELGKVDCGGGGTVAVYVANRNIDVVDIGVPMLCMHAPFELVAKQDVYMTYKAFVAFKKD